MRCSFWIEATLTNPEYTFIPLYAEVEHREKWIKRMIEDRTVMLLMGADKYF